MQSGSAAQTLGVLQQVLSDIGKAVTENGRNGTSSCIPTSIENTMSDQHIVEENFNELLQTYRADCLSGVTENWQHMAEMEQLEVSKTNNFFCGMHFMVAMADQAYKTLKGWEKLQFGEEKVGAGTIHLVRTMCKAE